MNQIRYVLLTITLVALVGVSALALNVPNSFVSGDVISAAEMNANFAAVEAAVTALENAQPIVAHGRAAGSLNFVTATTEAEDIVTVSLTAPAAGVVVVQATAQAGLSGTTNPNFMAFQIDTTEGGVLNGNGEHDFLVGFEDPANTGTAYLPVAIQRAFEVGAGTSTFRLEATNQSSDGSQYLWNPTITATWYPAAVADIQVPVLTLDAPGGRNQP